MKNKLIETDNLITTHQVCLDVIQNLKFIGLVGETGYGKTTSLQTFIKNNFQYNMYYIKVRKSMTTKLFYSEMLNAIGGETGLNKGSVFSMINRIAFILNNSGKKNILIIDEAGRLTKNQWHYIQEVRDETESSTGIIISGPEYFKSKLTEWKDKNIEGIPEVYRRIGGWVHLKKPTSRELKAILKTHKISDVEFIEIALKAQNFGELTNLIINYFLLKNNK
jgi:AAA domain-containing protein